MPYKPPFAVAFASVRKYLELCERLPGSRSESFQYDPASRSAIDTAHPPATRSCPPDKEGQHQFGCADLAPASAGSNSTLPASNIASSTPSTMNRRKPAGTCNSSFTCVQSVILPNFT